MLRFHQNDFLCVSTRECPTCTSIYHSNGGENLSFNPVGTCTCKLLSISHSCISVIHCKFLQKWPRDKISDLWSLSRGFIFQTFLSQKYGYRPFPHHIPATEFDSLAAAVDDQDDKQLLQAWFNFDDNAVPPEYVLQPISTQFKDFVDPPSSEAKQRAIKDWWNVFLQLQNALRKAAVKVLTKDAAHKYLQSGTVHGPSNSAVLISQPWLSFTKQL